MPHFVTQDAVERGPGQGLGAVLAQMAKQRHCHGFAEAEHSHRRSQHIEFNGIVLSGQAETGAVNRWRRGATSRAINIIAHPGMH